MDRISKSINKLAFFWSFPEMVAMEDGYYGEEDLEVDLHDSTPQVKVPSKNKMYKTLQRSGMSDVYHAGEWVSISRVVGSSEGKIVAFSHWKKEALNGSFGLYAKPGRDVIEVADLKGKLVAVEEGTGSYYTTIEDLERHMTKEQINLKRIGDPHERLLAIVNGEVSAGSLLGPYIDLAERLGLFKILESERRKGTLMVAKRDMDAGIIKKFLRGTNKAIKAINKDPEKYRPLYFEKFQAILERLPSKIRMRGEELGDTIKVPKWSEWDEYPRTEFETSYRWMVERGMIVGGYSYDTVVDSRIFEDGDIRHSASSVRG